MAYPTISTLPDAPSRQDPTNFATEADAFLGALPAFGTQTNTAGSYIEGKAALAETSATNAATSETNAGTSETNAATSASTSTTKASESAASAVDAANSAATAGNAPIIFAIALG